METKVVAIFVIVVLLAAGVVGIVFLGPMLFPTGPRVAIVFATGGLGDKSFNDAAFEGAMMAQDEFAGWNFTYAEPTQISEYEGFLRDYSEAGTYSLIIAIGFDQAEALDAVAADFPAQKYAIVDMVVDQPNVASLVFDEHEGSALVGAIAGLTTQSDMIGFVGGLDIPLINKFAAGYVWGADHVNDGINYTIAYTNDWVDTTAGQNLADGMYTAGTDVIFAAAGRAGLGVFTSAKNNNDTSGFDNPLWVIGVDSPQMYLGCENPSVVIPPSVGLTSMLKRVDIAVYDTIASVVDGTFAGGFSVFNLGNGGLGYEVNTRLLTLDPAIITAVENLKAGIIDGTYTVPSNITAMVDAITY
ncbi:MAG: BMP family ABC transporter substrate-binding protein [Candidatus Thorarchaeota archaeon]|nr:BMP family ABC transporter substrate-binding protein [Candidatus Thorarchaeota archaeon]